MATKKKLKKMSAGKVTIFKIQNRKGFAALCMQNLTEGKTPLQAFYRMTKAVKRKGYELKGKAPKTR